MLREIWEKFKEVMGDRLHVGAVMEKFKFAFLLDSLWSWLRACAVCGSSLGETPWLCADCQGQMLFRVSVKKRIIFDSIVHYYLISWFSGDDFVDCLVSSLKGGGLCGVYHQMASLHSSSLGQGHLPGGIYYPSGGGMDHGWQWSQVWSQILDCSSTPLIIKNRGEKQALLSRRRRRERGFQVPSKIFENPLFVDDVVTSGATAYGAYQALGRPKTMKVWSLFYRNSHSL